MHFKQFAYTKLMNKKYSRPTTFTDVDTFLQIYGVTELLYSCIQYRTGSTIDISNLYVSVCVCARARVRVCINI